MAFFDRRKDDDDRDGKQLAIGMELPRVYYLLGPPEERIDHADGFTMIFKKTDLMGIFRSGIKTKVTRVTFRDQRVVSFTSDEDK